MPTSGSSPHTRGAPGLGRCCTGGGGIIPAYAGSTAPRRTGRFGRTDHPRIRGEHARADEAARGHAGSSPHTRGAPYRFHPGSHVRRIIPAYAGSTLLSFPKAVVYTDHPRIRGEHGGPADGLHAGPGSSPHTRGARRSRLISWMRWGIIPAYAGSTSLRLTRSEYARDHPRIRGEHLDHRHPPDAGAGSSPHTRGARSAPWRTLTSTGIIPAYAGSTERLVMSHGQRRDHPRIRGEHYGPDRLEALGEGSSPHTRGARPFSFPSLSASGIIPAYAGSTWRAWRRRPEQTGSSPHTRGALRPGRLDVDADRIIPAYAGSTSSRQPVRGSGRDHPRIRGEHFLL